MRNGTSISFWEMWREGVFVFLLDPPLTFFFCFFFPYIFFSLPFSTFRFKRVTASPHKADPGSGRGGRGEKCEKE